MSLQTCFDLCVAFQVRRFLAEWRVPLPRATEAMRFMRFLRFHPPTHHPPSTRLRLILHILSSLLACLPACATYAYLYMLPDLPAYMPCNATSPAASAAAAPTAICPGAVRGHVRVCVRLCIGLISASFEMDGRGSVSPALRGTLGRVYTCYGSVGRWSW